ncbi:MAG: hypothetical protein ACOVNR_10330, partial [Chitinophagaceae bacterium]
MAFLKKLFFLLSVLILSVVITVKGQDSTKAVTAEEDLYAEPKSLVDCYLPEMMVDRIYRLQPKEMVKLQEDFQQNARIEGEEVVLRVKLMFKENFIIGFYQLIPVRTMNPEKAERIFFQFPVEYCCEDTVLKEKFCTQFIDSTFEYDKAHPKHTIWKQKVNGKIWMEEEEAAAKALLEAKLKKKEKKKPVKDSVAAAFGNPQTKPSKKELKKKKYHFEVDTTTVVKDDVISTDSLPNASKNLPIPTKPVKDSAKVEQPFGKPKEEKKKQKKKKDQPVWNPEEKE